MDQAPTKVVAGVTPGWHRLRVVDAVTGEPIAGVREADVDAGTIIRSEIDESGNLVIKDNSFVTVTEQRAVRIEWAGEPLLDGPTPGETV